MFKKVMCYLFTLALLVAIAVIPVSAESEFADYLVFEQDYGNVNYKGNSKSEGALPIKSDYAENLTLEAYVKINDFETPTVIAGAWGGALHGYAFWCLKGDLYFSAADTNGNNHVIFPASVTANWVGKWLHLVGVKEGNTNKFYCFVEGADDYEMDETTRTHSVLYTDAPQFIINGGETEFEGAGDFVLGTVRLYNVDMSDNLEEMRAECEENLKNAGDEETPSAAPSQSPSNDPSESPSGNPSESPSNKPTDNPGNNNGGSNSNKTPNATTFDLGIVSLAAVALSSMVAVKKRK